MKSQRRSYEINEWRCSLQFDSRKISVASKIAFLEVSAYAQPIAGCLQWEMDVLAGFEFENGEPSGARHGEEIENAMLAAGVREYLRIDEARVESGIDARHIFADLGFKPALRLRAIKSVARFAGERVTVVFEMLK